MMEYNEFRKRRFEFYRKKCSKYIPFKKLLRKIDKTWQIYRYNQTSDNEESRKPVNPNKKFRWKYVIEEVKYY